MKSLMTFLIGLAAWSSPVMCQAPSYTISTVAGGGANYPTDGSLATADNIPAFGVEVDAAGNFYISSANANAVWEVTPDGILHAFAGGRSPGYSGDGGPAIGAGLKSPRGLAFDVAGNLYIADYGNNCVRRVDGNGVITTVAGGGALVPGLGDGGPPTNAVLSFPQGVAVDAAGNLYIADSLDNRVRMVDQTGNISTIAGGGLTRPGDGGPATSAFLDRPLGVAVDSAGNLYIADTLNNRIRMVTNGTITTVAGSGSGGYSGDGGPATKAGLSGPNGVAVDSLGNLYIADTGANRIRMVTPDGTITTIAGNGQVGFTGDGGPATAATLKSPEGLAVGADGVSIYVADFSNGRVRLLTPAAQ